MSLLLHGGISSEALRLIAALLASSGALLVLGLAGPGATPIVVGLVALLCSGIIAFGKRALADRSMPIGLAVGIVALLLVGIEIRSVAPDATVAAFVVALTLAALAVAAKLRCRSLNATAILLAAGATMAAQGVYFLLHGGIGGVGVLRGQPWATLFMSATYILAGTILVLAEVRRWKLPLVLAGAAVIGANVARVTGAIELGSWVAIPFYGLLAVFVVRTLWSRVPLSVGRRVVGGFGLVILFVLLLAWVLMLSLGRSLDLSESALISNDVRLELSRLDAHIQQIDRVQTAYVVSGEPFLRARASELAIETELIGERLAALTAGRDLGQPTQRLLGSLREYAAALDTTSTTRRRVFVESGLRPERDGSFLAISERLLDFELAERDLRNAEIVEAQREARTLGAFVIAGTGIVVALAATFAIVLSREIGRRTLRLQIAASDIASGRPYQEVLEIREDGDDLDALARAFELMRRRLAALAVAEAHRSAELRSVLDAATDIGIIATDPQGITTSFSRGAERMLGWTAEEMIGEAMPSPRIHDLDELAAYAKTLDGAPEFDTFVAAARVESTVTQHWTYLHKDGTRIPVEVAISARRDHDGNLMGFLGIARDLTRQRASEAALTAAKVAAEGADRAKSAFLADMSHELRTPLNAILGFSELLTEQLASTLTDRQKRFFSNIHVSGEHLLGLINEVLDLSKVEAGRLEVRPEVIELAALLEPAIVSARADAERAGLAFERAHATGLVHLDAVRTRQVLFNLLSNAVKFTPAPGTVRLDVRFDGDALVMRVVDSGIGIPVDEASKIFGLFERVNRERSDASGTGLGLALSKRIVELQGGTISFESAVGHGSTFTVTFPDARYRVVQSEAILIVEDNWADAELLAALASEEGLATHRVTTLAEAVEALRHARPLAVVLDLFLPDGHGASILEAIKSSAVTAEVPVLVVTSATDTARFRLMGAACMTKPIDPVGVRAWLRGVAPRLSPEVAA